MFGGNKSDIHMKSATLYGRWGTAICITKMNHRKKIVTMHARMTQVENNVFKVFLLTPRVEKSWQHGQQADGTLSHSRHKIPADKTFAYFSQL